MSDAFDPARFKLSPEMADELAKATPKRSKQPKRTEPFLLITLQDIVTGGKALRDRRLLVWLYIKYRAWKESSNTVAIGNRNLQSWGVSPWTKCRALRDFERAGLISVDWRERTSPVVTLSRL
jgi:hypothetical protein